MNYIQYPNQQYGGVPRPAYQTGGWTNRIRPVSSIEEVRAASIDFDGSVFYFSDLANKRIYTKQINVDGTAQLNMYELKEMPIVEQQPITIDTSNFVTRKEFENVIEQLKNILAAPNQVPKNIETVQEKLAEPQKQPEKEIRSFEF